MKRSRVAETVKAELEGRTKTLKPIVERHRKEVEQRREKLVEKGHPRLEGIAVHRAMQLVDHL